MSNFRVRALVMIFLRLVTLSATLAADSESEKHYVVILNSNHAYLPGFRALDTVLQASILESSEKPVEFIGESLDLNRFPRAQIEDELLALFEAKYLKIPVSVVIAVDADALEFAEHHAETIWPRATIRFASVQNHLLPTMQLKPGTVGVATQLGMAQTVELALQLKPKTRKIVVIAGVADIDQRMLALARSSLERYGDGLEVQYLVGLSSEALIAFVAALPDDAVVLYLSVFRDRDGNLYVPRDVLRQIAERAPVPIFGMFETYLDLGITAGAITTYEIQGSSAGKLVARLLNGEDPVDIGEDILLTPTCLADWQQLQRLGIPDERLPDGCEVRLRQVSLWEQYWWQLLAIAAVFMAQSALIIQLVINRRRLGQAQSNLRAEYAQRADIEREADLLRQRLTRFSRERSLGAMATTLAHEISQPLIAIQNYAQAAVRRFRDNTGDKQKIIEILRKIEGQAERAGGVTQRVRSLINSNAVQLSAVSLSELVKDVIPMVQSESDESCAVEYLPIDNAVTVLVDRLQVQLVLVNLLSNAMHSMAERGTTGRVITIDASVLDQQVQVSVTDEGLGITPDQLPYIFEPMYSKKGTGMGMGLAICRDIVELHGGHIWHEENPCGGAIFRFTLRAGNTHE